MPSVRSSLLHLAGGIQCPPRAAMSRIAALLTNFLSWNRSPHARGVTCSERLAPPPLTGRKAMSGPAVEGALALPRLKGGVEGPSGLRLDALEPGAHAPTEQRLRRAGADPLAGDRLPDGELAPAPPAAAAVRLLLLDDLSAAQ